MRHLNDAAWSRTGSAAGEPPLDPRGFTNADLLLLQEAHQCGVARRGWGRAQFVTNECSQYLAIWNRACADQAPPTVSIVRFGKTGTYALLVDGKIVANGRTLDVILSPLAVTGSTLEQS